MHERSATIEVTELNIEDVIEGLSREMKRLKSLADEARDRADRDTWAVYEVRRHSLHRAWSSAVDVKRELGELSPEAQEEARGAVGRKRHKMPRSAANAEILRREREEAQEAAREYAIRKLKPVPKSASASRR